MRDQALGVRGDLHRAGLGGLLHPRGDVHGVAHRGVLQAQIRAHLADHDLARVDADSDVQIQAALGCHLRSVGRDRLHDVQPRGDRALRIVLVRDGGAEEREDRIPHQTRERALVPVDRRDQAFERAVHDLGPVLWVQGLRHRGRALDVAEDHRDDAALPLHRTPDARRLELGEHALGQVGLEAGIGFTRRGHGQARAAVQAEASLVRVRGRALGARLRHVSTIAAGSSLASGPALQRP